MELNREQLDKLKRNYLNSRGIGVDLFFPGTEKYREELEKFKDEMAAKWKLEDMMKAFPRERFFLEHNREKGQEISRFDLGHGWLYTRTVWSGDNIDGSMVFVPKQEVELAEEPSIISSVAEGSLRVERRDIDDETF
jgi:hypothetical protein